MIKAIFFDQDNTLFETSKISKKGYRYAIEEVSKRLKINSSELFYEWKQVVEKTMLSKKPKERLFRFSLSEVLKETPNKQTMVDFGVGCVLEIINKEIEMTPGSLEFLRQNREYKIVVFTEDSKEQSDMKFDKFSLDSLVDMKITSDEIGSMKPDISYYEPAWEKFDLKTSECIYVGDNWEKDLKIGQEKGGIGVSFGYKDTRADFSIFNMMELKGVIEECNIKS